LVALAIAAAIFAQSSQPSPNLSSTLAANVASVVGHLLLYAALAFALVKARANPHFPAVAGMVLLAVAYGISDEVHQSFVASRDGSVFDVGLDVLGSLAGALLGRRSLVIPNDSLVNGQLS